MLNVQERQTEEDYFTPQVFQIAADWISQNTDNSPFFLWVDSFAPHEYWDPPPAFADRYFVDPAVKDFIVPSMCDENETSIQRTKALYYGYVTFVDKWIGHLLNWLEDLKLTDETVLIFLTDHGTELMDNGAFGKGKHGPRNYNAKINLWFRYPDQVPVTVEPLILSHYFCPTLLNLAGIEHQPLDGQSLWPLVQRQETTGDEDTVIHAWINRVCVRSRE